MTLNHPKALGSRSKPWAGISLFLLTFLVYLRTLAPGVYGFDSAELATGVFTQGIVHPPGYPLYLLIGKLFTFLPFGDVAYRLNLMSAFFASLTVLLLYHAISNIIENRFAAWFAAMLFAVSYYFWQMALIAEVYTLNTAFLAGDLLLLSLWRKKGSRKYLLAFSLFYGLTLTTQTSGLLFAPAFAWLVLSTPHWKRSYWPLIGPMFLLFLVGLTPNAYLSLRASASPVMDYSKSYSGVDLTTLSGLWWMVSDKAWGFLVFGYAWHEIPGELIHFTTYLWRNYLGIGVILGLIGIVWLWRRSFAWTISLLLAFITYSFFVANYRVIDKDTMFLPAYAVWAVFIAGGFTAVYNFIEQSLSKNLNDLWLMRMVKIISIVFIALGLVLNWRWVDMSKVDNYAMFAEEFMSVAAPDAVIIAPWSSAAVLEYYQVTEGQRPDLLIFNSSLHAVARYYELWQKGMSQAEIYERINADEVDLINQYIHQKTVYTVEYNPELAQKFEYLPAGPAFKLAKQ
jgi:Protein O-mannosyl-transferase TMEM260-like